MEVLSEQEAKFCILYINATAPMAGDARLCYQAVFGEKDDATAQYKASELMQKECVKERLAELEANNAYSAASLKTKITSTLVKIMDECSGAEVVDRYGRPISSAPMRAVAVNAAKTLNDMFGIKEAIEHKVSLENPDGCGIVFNINVPQPTNEEDQFNAD